MCSLPDLQSICVSSQGLYRSSCLIQLCWLCRLLLCFAAECMSSTGLLTEAAVSPAPAAAAQSPFGSSHSFGEGEGEGGEKKEEASAQEIRTCQHWFMSKDDCILLPDECVFVWVCVSTCVFCPCLLFKLSLPWCLTNGFYATKVKDCIVSLELKRWTFNFFEYEL